MGAADRCFAAVCGRLRRRSTAGLVGRLPLFGGGGLVPAGEKDAPAEDRDGDLPEGGTDGATDPGTDAVGSDDGGSGGAVTDSATDDASVDDETTDSADKVAADGAERRGTEDTAADAGTETESTDSPTVPRPTPAATPPATWPPEIEVPGTLRPLGFSQCVAFRPALARRSSSSSTKMMGG